MSNDKEKQAKKRAKVKADPELYQAQLLKDKEKETMSDQQLQEHQLKEWLCI